MDAERRGCHLLAGELTNCSSWESTLVWVQVGVAVPHPVVGGPFQCASCFFWIQLSFHPLELD